MATTKRKPYEPDYEQPIKTLSLRETVFLLLNACQLPANRAAINAHIRSLAKRRLATVTEKSPYSTRHMTEHLKQYV